MYITKNTKKSKYRLLVGCLGEANQFKEYVELTRNRA